VQTFVSVVVEDTDVHVPAIPAGVGSGELLLVNQPVQPAQNRAAIRTGVKNSRDIALRTLSTRHL
jgi:hypothetical protein